MAFAGLTACGGQGIPPRAAAPAQAVVLPADAVGFSFVTRDGALAVARAFAPLGFADGLPAKRAAVAYCTGQGRALNPAAFGRFAGGAWLFQGGCA